MFSVVKKRGNMSRFYVPKENVRGNEIIVEGDEAHHALDVMRLSDGDKVVIFDGTGAEYSGFIKEADRKGKKAIVEIIRKDVPLAESLPEIVLAQAIPKKNKMDYIVEKATELGVSKIVPIVTERTIVRPDDRSSGKKLDRWRRNVLEAAKQCARSSVPEITEITSFKKLVEELDQYDLALMACLGDTTISIKESLKNFKSGKILIFIGPEGDFTPEEMRMADRDNCRFVSLGNRVLKSDTAGLFVLSVLSYEFVL